MRPFYYEILIDGKPVLMPDEDVALEYTDLDADESGRDESGVMHRIVTRRNVMKLALPYNVVTREEYLYMESLFAGKSTFTLTFMDHDAQAVQRQCYRSNHSITVRNAKTGLYRNYKCSIIEC